MKRSFFPLRLALLIGALWQASEVVFAQSEQTAVPAEASGASPGGASPNGDVNQEYSFVVDIQVVTVPVTVTDPNGDFVTDLEVNDFTVLDNGVPQKIESFDLSLEPLSIAILVETSSRVASLLPEVRNTGILFTQLIVGETGEAAVVAIRCG
jgi:hypothetical protein